MTETTKRNLEVNPELGDTTIGIKAEGEKKIQSVTARQVLQSIAEFFRGQPDVQETQATLDEYHRELNGLHSILTHAKQSSTDQSPEGILKFARASAGKLSHIHHDMIAMEHSIFTNLPDGKTALDLVIKIGGVDERGEVITSQEQLDRDGVLENSKYIHISDSGTSLTIHSDETQNWDLLIRPYLDAKYYAEHPDELDPGEPIKV